jgi:hypothetical protein
MVRPQEIYKQYVGCPPGSFVGSDMQCSERVGFWGQNFVRPLVIATEISTGGTVRPNEQPMVGNVDPVRR